jgi:S1-C subfamily serine protease
MALFAVVIALAALFLGATGLSRVLDSASGSSTASRQLDRSYDRSITQVPGASNPDNEPAPTQGWDTVAASVNPGIVDIQTQLSGGTGFGTGIILTADGRIVTNHHVIDGARRIVVTTVVDGQQYRARVVGSDPETDVAVLQLQGASGLTPATLGDSSVVRAGDAIAAVGNAGGRGGLPTVSPGNVLGTNRSIVASESYGGGNAQQLVGMIEVVADVQPGDSGGAVINTSGEVIGMTTAASAAENASPGDEPRGGGLGYAIPIDNVLDIVDRLVN